MTTKTHVDAPAERGQHEGMVQLGDLHALGAWKEDGEILSIKFSTASLSREQLQQLRVLQSNARPILLALGRKRATSDNHIVGFEEKSGTATFHVAHNSDQVEEKE